jgi:hypothetical protein
LKKWRGGSVVFFPSSVKPPTYVARQKLRTIFACRFFTAKRLTGVVFAERLENRRVLVESQKYYW